MSYEKLSNKAIGSMYLASCIGTIVVMGILVAVLHFLPGILPLLRYIIWGAMGLLLVSFIIGPPVRYQRYRYFIDEESIDVVEGFLFIERNIVPIERLHNIEISKGPINRLFGLSEVTVITAGSKVAINFLEDKKAEFIAESLKKRINAVAIEKKSENSEQKGAEQKKENKDSYRMDPIVENQSNRQDTQED